MLPQNVFWEPETRKNAFVAGALPQTPLGELTALPRPVAGFWWREICEEGKGS